MKAITEYFDKAGYETTYLISDYDHYSKNPLVTDHPNTEQIHVPAYKRNLSIRRLWSHYVFAKKVYKTLCSIKPEIVYCMFPPNSLVQQVVRYKRRTGAKLLLDCYDMWPESFPYQKYSHLLWIPFITWRKLRDDYVTKSDLLLCVSKAAENELRRIAPNVPIKILTPFVDVNMNNTYNSNVEGTITFCYLGNINHITDIQLGVHFLSLVQKRKPTTLHIIGGGQNLDIFTTQLIRNKVKVICHGVVFDIKEKSSIYSLCNFGLSIPRKEINSTMPLKVVEYLGCGLPVVNSAGGDISEIIGEYQAGININSEESENAVAKIFALTEADVVQMHQNALKVYTKLFKGPKFDSVFENVLSE